MNLDTIGQILKEERRKQALTIEEVSQLTRITPEKLRAIERGEESEFIAKIYIKGFIRAYAKVLSIDSEALINMLKFSKENPIEVKNISQIQKEKQPLTLIHIGLSVLILFCVISIIWVRSELMKYESKKSLKKSEFIESYYEKTIRRASKKEVNVKELNSLKGTKNQSSKSNIDSLERSLKKTSKKVIKIIPQKQQNKKTKKVKHVLKKESQEIMQGKINKKKQKVKKSNLEKKVNEKIEIENDFDF